MIFDNIDYLERKGALTPDPTPIPPSNTPLNAPNAPKKYTKYTKCTKFC